MIISARRQQHIKFRRKLRLGLQIDAVLVDVVVFFIAAVDRAFGVRPGQNRVDAVDKTLLRAQAQAVLRLCRKQFRIILNQRAVAQQIGVAGVALIDEALHKKIFVIKPRLRVAVSPAFCQTGANAG